MAVSDSGQDLPSVEIRVSGLIYVRIERCPRWLGRLLFAGAATLSGWVLARYPWMLGR
jgi:hypothetical protein